MTMIDRAVGALLGLACGDAVGTTLEEEHGLRPNDALICTSVSRRVEPGSLQAGVQGSGQVGGSRIRSRGPTP
jgi:hypothetical protein